MEKIKKEKRKYVKPTFELVRIMTFPYDCIKNWKHSCYGCRQCSSCHGCR